MTRGQRKRHWRHCSAAAAIRKRCSGALGRSIAAILPLRFLIMQLAPQHMIDHWLLWSPGSASIGFSHNMLGIADLNVDLAKFYKEQDSILTAAGRSGPCLLNCISNGFSKLTQAKLIFGSNMGRSRPGYLPPPHLQFARTCPPTSHSL